MNVSIPKEDKPKEEGHPSWTLPAELDTEDFEDAWILYYRHRLDIKEPLTQIAGEVMLKELAEMGEARAIKAIEHSVARGWKGIFEPSSNGHGPKSEHAEAVDDESGGYNL